MTNWMTVAGIVLIAGGIATLIVFRRTIWTGGDRRTRGSRGVAEASPRSTGTRNRPRRGGPEPVRPVLPAQAGAPDISGSQQAADILARLAANDEAEAADILAGLAVNHEAEAADVLAGLAVSGEAEAADVLAGLAASGEAEAADNTEGRVAGNRRRARKERPGGLASLGLADDADDQSDDGDDQGAAGRRRRRRGGPMDMDDLRRQLRDALEDLKHERRDELEPAARTDPWERSAEPREPAYRDDAPERRLAQAVLARADAGTREGARFDPASGRLVPPASGAVRPAETRPVEELARARSVEGPGGARPVEELARARSVEEPGPARPADGFGDRVDGWVRPQYGTPEGPTGDYWKPVPDGAYADDSSAYGWPVPVERLPAAPAYPAPADGVLAESEPTAVVPQWPPARPSERIELPRTWSVRRWDTDAGGRDVWRPGNVIEVSRRRPSPRPSPAADRRGPVADARGTVLDARSTVYVSRHAAEPS